VDNFELCVVFFDDWFDGLYMADKNSINEFVSLNQIKELSLYILEVYGTDLPLEELNESIYLVMEDVPGIESISVQEIQLLNSQIRNQYYDETKRKK